MDNPFIIKSYESKDLFCDREKELQLMLRNCINQSDMTLISQRRMGKTGLILRLFDELKTTKPDIHTIYLDIFASRNIDDFIKLLAEATMKSFPVKTSIGERLMTFIKSLRPQLSFDNITGEPQLQIAYQTAHEKEYTLRGLFDFLDSQEVRIIIAIDEFQQIRDYPEKNMEALLKKPFYASTSFVSLSKIDEAPYTAFIRRLFNERQRNITSEAIQFILTWTRRHTYYTQQLCHTIYANGNQTIDLEEVKLACSQLMQQSETVYLQYRQMLTDKQWDYLIAIAKEESVQQITAAAFLKRHKIGTPSVSRRLADALCEKGLLNDDSTLDGTVYSVSDVFLSHWMERL